MFGVSLLAKAKGDRIRLLKPNRQIITISGASCDNVISKIIKRTRIASIDINTYASTESFLHMRGRINGNIIG